MSLNRRRKTLIPGVVSYIKGIMSHSQPPYHPREPVNPRFRVNFHHLREIALEEGNFGKELEDQEGCFKGEVCVLEIYFSCVHLEGIELPFSLLCT